jgi:hypothetical protein
MKKLMLVFALMGLAFASLFAQNTTCQNTVTLNTGYNHASSSPYAVGNWDNYWTVVSGPTTGACGPYVYPNPAAVISPAAGWDGFSSYPNAKWLSFRPTSDLNCNNTCASGLAPVVFERKFCMKQPDTIILDSKMRFDNSACLFIDGNLVPLSTVTTSLAATTYNTISGATGCQTCELWNDTKTFNGNYDARATNFKIFLSSGTHNIQIRVRNNSSVSFGAILEGTIKSKKQVNNFECPEVCSPNNTIAIKKILDKNCDGKFDPTIDAVGAGWQFNVTGPGSFSTSVTTDVTGYAFVTGLAVGSYTVTEVPQAGWTASNGTQTVNVVATQTQILNFFNCPVTKPCIEFAQTSAVCGLIVNGQQTYTISGLISNGNNIVMPFNPTVSSGTISSLSISTIPANASNQAFSFVYTPGITNPCFIVKFIDLNGNILCAKEFCVTLPVCQCLELTYNLVCNPNINPNNPQPYVYQVSINNPTAGNIIVPMASTTGVLTPSSITATPGGHSYLVYYTPNAGTTQACIRFGVGTVPLSIPLCKTPKECVPLPSCCVDAEGKLTCGPIINQRQTYIFTGTLSNYTTSASTPAVTSNVSGSITSFTPVAPIPSNTSSPISFVFTPTGTIPATICFYFAAANGTKICDSVCVKVPDCPSAKPCNDAAVLVASCETINGVQTIVLKGAVSSGNAVPMTLSIAALNSGTTTIVAGAGTLVANEVNHAFTIHHVPTTPLSNYCFEVTLTSLTQPPVRCKDTICIKNPCPSSKCIETEGKLTCGAVVNGVQTYNFAGALTNYTATTINPFVSSSVAGTISGFLPTTGIPSNTSALISFTFKPTGAMPANICFYFAPSKSTAICDTLCIAVPQCPPVVIGNKCCPTTKMKACCITTNEIKYEFTAATVPTMICGMIVTVSPSVGVTLGNAYAPTLVANPIVLGYTAFLPTVNAGATLTYYITIPTTNPLSTVSIQYVTCAGNKKDTCDVEQFKIGKKNIADATDVSLTGVAIKDSLFAKAFKIDFSKVKNKGKVKSVSIIPNDANASQDVFFAITGGEQFGNENKALIPLSESLQGTNSATFIFKNAINADNYKGELINIVTKRRVQEFKVMMFDEDGLLMSSSTVAGAMQAILASNELKSNISSMSIAPNPANDEVNLSFTLDVAQKISVDLYDLSGKWIKNIDNAFHSANQSQPLQFNVSELQNGLYFVRLTNASGQVFTQKLSVLR